jgi:beta-galactosidase/beta-glucuronidase
MKLKIPAFFYVLTSVCFSSLALGQSVMDLSGPWRFRLDPDDVGKSSGWYRESFPDSIQIPGVLQNQGYGNVPNVETPWIVKKKPMERMSKYPNWYRHPMFAKYRDPENFTFPYWFQPERHYVGVGS